MADQAEGIALQQQLDAHRSTLNVYLHQLALLGQAYVPPHIVSGIRTARSEIQQKKIYLRSIGITVADQQNDFEDIVDVKGFHADEGYKSHVKLYRDISRTLQSLAFAGDSLWMSATLESLKTFRHAIQEVKHVIEENAIYFETADLSELRQVVSMFERFTSGKELVINMRHDTADAEHANISQEIRRQISRNGRYKRRYEELVEQIRMSFKARIS